jgi:hypothetical protein
MSPRLDLAPKRTRESTSKVRTGCSTCKARRVKCDEGKPVCRRCAIGGRQCEYNAPRAAPPPRNLITVYLPPAQIQPVLFVNTPGLDFFHQNLAGKLDGQFDSRFWSRLVLQLSHSEPAVRHAVSAISVISQDIESFSRHSAGSVKASLEAQREWNRAVKSLSARIQAHPQSNLVPLVCCLLFTCVEFLRGGVESSMFHVQSGFNILAAIRRNSDAGGNPGFYVSSNELEAIENYIVPVFLRLGVLCSLAGRVTPPIYPSPSTGTRGNHAQEDLTDSRRRLFEISDTCIRFIGEATSKAALFQIDVDDLAEQAKLQSRLETWRDQLHDLLARMRTAGSPAAPEALHLLLVQYKVVYIWLRVCTTAGETATDSYHADFEELVHSAEQIAQSSGAKATPQPLSFDINILGPLYYATLKCRYPATRRRALDLLQLAPRQEGLWNARYAYATAKRIIEIEERHLNGQELPNETSRLHGLTLPDRESWVHNQGEMASDLSELDHTGVSSPSFSSVLEANFRTKPWGLLGEWQTITEYIKP